MGEDILTILFTMWFLVLSGLGTGFLFIFFQEAWK